MNTLLTEIQSFKTDLLEQLALTKTKDQLEKVRVAFIGRKGRLSDLMEKLAAMSLEEKRTYGPQLNELRSWAEEQYETIQKKLTAPVKTDRLFDITAYQPQSSKGSLHIYTQLIEQLEDIFISMGYSIADGPEVETDYYNFEALNIPADHPAREHHDTFWLDVPKLILRTHTSSVQARIMQAHKPPLAVFSHGRCYRNEATDASHEFMFTQGEWIFIDKNISIAHLLATTRSFLQHIFDNKKLKIRVRPSYFPFVEPGLEIDMSCPFCTTGCSICKKTTWIEIIGSGLIHQRVLEMSNINPQIYAGFAFALGIERLAMIKYGIDDIRLFHSSSLSMLNQF